MANKKMSKKMDISKIVIIVVASIVALVAILEIGLIIAREIMLNRVYGAKQIDTTPTKGKVEYITPLDGTPYFIKRNEDGSIADDGFKIITIGDMHLKTDFSSFTFKVLDRILEDEKPDLVILLGDNVVGRDDTEMHQTVKKFFDDREQYWAFVLGNHDAETYEATHVGEDFRKWAFEALSGSKYCVSRTETDESVYGVGNCVFNIKNSKGEIIQSVFLLDSGDHVTDERCQRNGVENNGGSSFIEKSQIAWYKKRVEELTIENNGVIPQSMVCFHIALPEFDIAYERALAKEDDAIRLYGDKWEKVDGAVSQTGMFEQIKASGSTKTVIVGHDHINGFAVNYQGVNLVYTQGLQWDGAYNRRKNNYAMAAWYKWDKKACFYIEGCTDVMIRADGTTELMPKYAQQEGWLKGCEEELEKASYGVKGTYRE